MNTKYHVPGSAHDVIRSPRETQCGGGVYDHIVVINPASYSVHALYVFAPQEHGGPIAVNCQHGIGDIVDIRLDKGNGLLQGLH